MACPAVTGHGATGVSPHCDRLNSGTPLPDPTVPARHPRSSIVDPPKNALLAVDLGLRMGLAWYDGAGRLVAYRSQHVPNRSVLRRAAYGLLRERAVSHVILEGGGALEALWTNEAKKAGARVRTIQAGTWRRDLLLPRQRRSGRTAKLEADTLAREVIEDGPAPRPTSLRHDAAEAILIGLWAVQTMGWDEG